MICSPILSDLRVDVGRVSSHRAVLYICVRSRFFPVCSGNFGKSGSHAVFWVWLVSLHSLARDQAGAIYGNLIR